MKLKKHLKKEKTPKKKNLDKPPLKIKTMIIKFKKWQEMEKEKKELKKQDINYSIKPKGYFARKIGVASFWVLFSFMFLVVCVTLFSPNDEATAENEMNFEINQATTPEAIQFAENFLKEYFTWTVNEEGNKVRQEKLMKYISEELVGHPAFDVKNLEWNSTFKKSEIREITEKGDHLAYITFLVDFEFTKVINADDPEQNEKGPEIKTLQKYIEVPVAYDGYSYGIYELPKFTHIFEDKTTVKSVKTSTKFQQADIEIVNKVNEFLPTFFKTYAEDEKEKLNYMLKKENITNGLNGSMRFEDIENLQVFNGNEENQFFVFVEVIFVEPETQTPFVVNHQLELTLEQDKLLVSGMNDAPNKGVISTKDSEKTNRVEIETNTINEGGDNISTKKLKVDMVDEINEENN